MIKARIIKVCRCFVISLIMICGLTFSCLSSFAISPNDASSVLSNVKCDSALYWLQRGHSTSFSFEVGTTQLRKPSTQWFRTENRFSYSSSFGGTNASSISYFQYSTQMLEWHPGYVYNINLTLDYQTGSGFTIDQAKKLLLILPVSVAPVGQFAGNQFSTYFYNGYAPTSVTQNANIFYLTYNIAVYPETTFSRSVQNNGVYYTDGFGIYNYRSGLITSAVNPSTGDYGSVETLVFIRAPEVNVYLSEQYNTLVIQGQLDGLSEQIDEATGQVISAIEDQTQQILYPPVPTPDFDQIEAAHQSEEALTNAITSTMSFTSVVDTMNVAQIIAGAQTGALWLREWLNAAYSNPVINAAVSVCLAFALLYQFYRGLL